MDRTDRGKLTRKELEKELKQREELFKKALEGDAEALVYLGKKYLGQAET